MNASITCAGVREGKWETVALGLGRAGIGTPRWPSAAKNVRVFTGDVAVLAGCRTRVRGWLVGKTPDESGCYPFLIQVGQTRVSGRMPGYPVGQVRCTRETFTGDQPRLVVGGTSWLWYYALDAVLREVADRDMTERLRGTRGRK